MSSHQPVHIFTFSEGSWAYSNLAYLQPFFPGQSTWVDHKIGSSKAICSALNPNWSWLHLLLIYLWQIATSSTLSFGAASWCRECLKDILDPGEV